MLTPEEFSVGPVAAAANLTLILPRGRYERPMLISAVADTPMAIILTDNEEFDAFECEGNTHWKGLLIPNVKIEVDERSLFDPDSDFAPFGALIRSGTNLSIAANRRERYSFNHRYRIPIVVGLDEVAAHTSVGFYQWQITIGSDHNKRVLWTVRTKAPVAEG
jgi:hypothetical protein